MAEVADVDYELARFAMVMHNGDEDATVSALVDPAQRGQLRTLLQAQRMPPSFVRQPSSNSLDPMLRTGKRGAAAFENFLVQHNFLIYVGRLIEDELLPGVTKGCIICNDELQHEGLKPTICPKPLCALSYSDIGVGFNLASAIKAAPEVIDLLICMTLAVTANPDRMLHYTPKGVQSHKGDQHFRIAAPATAAAAGAADANAVTPSQTIDFNLLRTTLLLFPSVREMIEFIDGSIEVPKNFETRMDAISPLLRPLLQWIITSNRTHFRKLTPEERSPSFPADNQFVLLSATPEQEARFQLMKAKAERKKGAGEGSFWAWHGSGFANWHSIVRGGLKNMSNTKFMSAGAVYGAGIYLSQDFQTSCGYAGYGGGYYGGGSGAGWPNSMFKQPLSCLALCEIANLDDPSWKGPNLKQNCVHYVIPEEDAIITRYILIATFVLVLSIILSFTCQHIQLGVADFLCCSKVVGGASSRQFPAPLLQAGPSRIYPRSQNNSSWLVQGCWAVLSTSPGFYMLCV